MKNKLFSYFYNYREMSERLSNIILYLEKNTNKKYTQMMCSNKSVR